MSRKFNRKSLIDDASATNGVWMTIRDAGETIGKFRVRHFRRFSTVVDKEVENIHKATRKRFKTDELTQSQSAAGLLAYHLLTDWDEIEDDKGPVPFSMEDAFDFFLDPDYLEYALALIGRAGDKENYPKDDHEVSKDAAKN